MFLAGVAHPVERHLAKVEVASSSLVTRSNKKPCFVNPTKQGFLNDACLQQMMIAPPMIFPSEMMPLR